MMNSVNILSMYIMIFGIFIIFIQCNFFYYIYALFMIIFGFFIATAIYSILLLMFESYKNYNFVHWNTGLPGTKLSNDNLSFSLPSYNPTGIENLDQIIEHLTLLIIRDFVLYWHDKYFDDKKFPKEIMHIIYVMINRLCAKIKTVRWTHLFAVRISALFTLHVKMFIKSIKKIDEKEPLNSNHTKIIHEFFNIESTKQNIFNHKSICSDNKKEIEYLTFIIESLLFILLPEVQFDNQVVRYVVRDLFVMKIVLPFINYVCDPDYINQTIHAFRKDIIYTNESFISAIRITNSHIDLYELIKSINMEITKLSGNDMDQKEYEDLAKKQIASLLFIKRLAMSKIESNKSEYQLQPQPLQPVISSQNTSNINTLEDTLSTTVDSSGKYPEVPFKTLLENNHSFPYLVDYFQETGEDNILFFYFAIKDFFDKFNNILSCEEFKSKSISTDDEKIISIRQEAIMTISTCRGLFEGKANSLDMKNTLEDALKDVSQPYPNIILLKKLQDEVLNYLQNPTCIDKFYNSPKYQKMCAEIVGHGPRKSSISSLTSSSVVVDNSTNPSNILNEVFQKEYNIDSTITETFLCGHPGQQYSMYVIVVSISMDNIKYTWKIHRRFRHFVELHEVLIGNFSIINNLNFPEKKIFGNKQTDNVERRKNILDGYIKSLINMELFRKNKQFFTIVSSFLRKHRDHIHQNEQNISKCESNKYDNVNESDNIFKNDLDLALSKQFIINLDYEELESMSMSILVSLIEELFDLKNKTPWLARQIKTFVKEVYIVTHGDRHIRKLIDSMESQFSSSTVTEYLIRFRDSFWPSNIWSGLSANRSQEVKSREKIIATSILIGSIPTELRRFLGDDVSLDGIYKLFNLLQIPALNKRLFYTIMETIIEFLFPENTYAEIYKNLSEFYTKSSI